MPNTNRDKGNKFERDLARYFREHGVTDAERRVVTGFRTAQRVSADLGDLRDIPGICIQAKNMAGSRPRGLMGQELADIMAETDAQCAAANEALWLVIEKRKGHQDIGMSWCHFAANMYAGLAFDVDPFSPQWAEHTYPVRIELRYVIDQLVQFSHLCSEKAA